MEKLREGQEVIFQGKDFYIVSGFNQNNEQYFEAWFLKNDEYYRKFKANNYFNYEILQQLLKIFENKFSVIEKTIIAKKEKCVCINSGDEVIKMRNGKIYLKMSCEEKDIFRREKGLENNISDASQQSNN